VSSAAMLGAAYAGGAAVIGLLGMRQWPGVWPVLSTVAVAFGVAACAVLNRRVEAVARPLRWLGRRTLPIYVIHMVPLALLDGALRSRGLRTTPVVEAVAPLVLTAVVIALCLAVHAALVRVRLGALFDPLLVVDGVRARRSPTAGPRPSR